MKPDFSITRSLINLSLASMLAFGCTASNADNPSTPLSVDIAMVNNNKIVQGEPILLHYQINNTSDRQGFARLSQPGKTWYTVNLTDTAGKSVALRPEDTPLTTEERGATHEVRLEPHRSQQGDIVSRFVTPASGQYTLTIHVSLPYGPALVTTKPVLIADPDALVTGLYQNDYQFPITVLPADATRLTATAKSLEKMAANTRSAEWHIELINMLCSLPEAQALPSWQALADDSNANYRVKSQLARELSELHSEAAIDVVASMVWNPDEPIGAFQSSSYWLIRAYLYGDDKMKQHIKDIYDLHGVPFPDHPILPDITD